MSSHAVSPDMRSLQEQACLSVHPTPLAFRRVQHRGAVPLTGCLSKILDVLQVICNAADCTLIMSMLGHACWAPAGSATVMAN